MLASTSHCRYLVAEGRGQFYFKCDRPGAAGVADHITQHSTLLPSRALEEHFDSFEAANAFKAPLLEVVALNPGWEAQEQGRTGGPAAVCGVKVPCSSTRQLSHSQAHMMEPQHCSTAPGRFLISGLGFSFGCFVYRAISDTIFCLGREERADPHLCCCCNQHGQFPGLGAAWWGNRPRSAFREGRFWGSSTEQTTNPITSQFFNPLLPPFLSMLPGAYCYGQAHTSCNFLPSCSLCSTLTCSVSLVPFGTPSSAAPCSASPCISHLVSLFA